MSCAYIYETKTLKKRKMVGFFHFRNVRKRTRYWFECRQSRIKDVDTHFSTKGVMNNFLYLNLTLYSIWNASTVLYQNNAAISINLINLKRRINIFSLIVIESEIIKWTLSNIRSLNEHYQILGGTTWKDGKTEKFCNNVSIYRDRSGMELRECVLNKNGSIMKFFRWVK